MPSPGISFGDLMVFVAVVIIVSVFLAAVRSFIKRVEMLDPSAEPQRRQPESTPLEKSRAPAPTEVGSPKIERGAMQ